MRIKEEYRLNTKHLPGLNPILYGQEACESGSTVEGLRPYWLLHYVVSGKGTLKTSNAVHTVTPTQIFVVRPHEAHCYIADSTDPWHYIWIAFESDIPLPAILQGDVITAPAAGRLFTDFLSAAQMQDGAEEYVSGKLWELISLFLRMQNEYGQCKPYVLRAKQYMEENFMHGIKVTDIARHVSLDRSYFSTVFKQETGLAPQEYLAKCRLERAAELLMQGDLAITAVADTVGYNDIVNFSRMFKKHFGVPPSKYREHLLSQPEV